MSPAALPAPVSPRKLYPASPINGRRQRATRAELQHRRAALYEIVEAMRPTTVRRVFYEASVRGIADKSEAGYVRVQTDPAVMRRAGDLPYGWLADKTPGQRKPVIYGGIEEALEDTAPLYRKSLWIDADCYVEIWLAKDALSGVVYPVTSTFDVPIIVARGYASLSFLHGSAEFIAGLEMPAFTYHVGDFEPSGANAGEKIEQTLHELAPDAEIRSERLGATPEQIDGWSLPTRPTKTTDSLAKGFGAISVELDPIEPDLLRAIVQDAIERHLPRQQLEVLKAAEASERGLLRLMVGSLQLDFGRGVSDP